MVKKLITVVVFMLIAGTLLYGQSTEETKDESKAAEGEKEKPKFGFNMNMNLGLASYEDYDENQIAFQKFSFFPEFSYGKWGLGLDFTFEFDGDFKLRDLDNDGKADTWSKFTDYIYKIYYVRYGQKGEPLYGRIGSFDSYTLGHGIILGGFSNTLFYPQVHQLGLNLDVDGTIIGFPIIGLESVVDDILDWDIMGLRLYARPLVGMEHPIIQKLKVGGSVVIDRDPQEDPTSADYGPPKDHPDSERVTVMGLDTELPIFEKGSQSLITYADWVTITGKGNGIVLGSTYRYAWFKLIAQLRFLGKEFVVNYFDPYYEVERATKYDSLDTITDSYIGYLIGTDLSLFNIVAFYFMFSDGFNDPEGPRIQTGVSSVEGAIPKIQAGLSYDKKDIDGFRDFFSLSGSLFQLRVAYKVSKFSSIVFIQQRTYTPSGESTAQTLVETQFSF